MKILKIININNFIVISDVHLKNPNDNISNLFLETLDNIRLKIKRKEIQIDAIFLMGDIFDFITVSKKFFLNLWENIFNKFYELKLQGVLLYFIEGNHDFGFEHFRSEKLDHCFTEYGDFIVEFTHKKLGTVVLRHGDNLICPATYHKFRKMVKSYLFQKFASFLISGKIMHFICNQYAKKSRMCGHYKPLKETFLWQCLDDYLKYYEKEFKKNLDTLFIGHIHEYIDTIFKNTHFLVGPDWNSAPNYIVCNSEGAMTRVFCREKNPLLYKIKGF